MSKMSNIPMSKISCETFQYFVVVRNLSKAPVSTNTFSNVFLKYLRPIFLQSSYMFSSAVSDVISSTCCVCVTGVNLTTLKYQNRYYL